MTRREWQDMAQSIGTVTALWHALGYDVIREEDFHNTPREPLCWVGTRFVIKKRDDRDPRLPSLLPYEPEPYFGSRLCEVWALLPGGRHNDDPERSHWSATKAAERWFHVLHPVLEDILTAKQWGAVRMAVTRQTFTDAMYGALARQHHETMPTAGRLLRASVVEDSMKDAPSAKWRKPKEAVADIGDTAILDKVLHNGTSPS